MSSSRVSSEILGRENALNIRLQRISILDAGVESENIARLGPRDSAELNLLQLVNEKPSGGYVSHSTELFEKALKRAAEQSGDFRRAMEDYRIPYKLTYTDASGTPFVNTGGIHWIGMLDRGEVHPSYCGIAQPAPRRLTDLIRWRRRVGGTAPPSPR